MGDYPEIKVGGLGSYSFNHLLFIQKERVQKDMLLTKPINSLQGD